LRHGSAVPGAHFTGRVEIPVQQRLLDRFQELNLLVLCVEPLLANSSPNHHDAESAPEGDQSKNYVNHSCDDTRQATKVHSLVLNKEVSFD
jgi:hypothetical protein